MNKSSMIESGDWTPSPASSFQSTTVGLEYHTFHVMGYILKPWFYKKVPERHWDSEKLSLCVCRTFDIGDQYISFVYTFKLATLI